MAAAEPGPPRGAPTPAKRAMPAEGRVGWWDVCLHAIDSWGATLRLGLLVLISNAGLIVIMLLLHR